MSLALAHIYFTSLIGPYQTAGITGHKARRYIFHAITIQSSSVLRDEHEGYAEHY